MFSRVQPVTDFTHDLSSTESTEMSTPLAFEDPGEPVGGMDYFCPPFLDSHCQHLEESQLARTILGTRPGPLLEVLPCSKSSSIGHQIHSPKEPSLHLYQQRGDATNIAFGGGPRKTQRAQRKDSDGPAVCQPRHQNAIPQTSHSLTTVTRAGNYRRGTSLQTAMTCRCRVRPVSSMHRIIVSVSRPGLCNDKVSNQASYASPCLAVKGLPTLPVFIIPGQPGCE